MDGIDCYLTGLDKYLVSGSRAGEGAGGFATSTGGSFVKRGGVRRAGERGRTWSVLEELLRWIGWVIYVNLLTDEMGENTSLGYGYTMFKTYEGFRTRARSLGG